jgi:hypothetical protein
MSASDGGGQMSGFQVWGMSGTGSNFRAVLSTMLVAAKHAIAT